MQAGTYTFIVNAVKEPINGQRGVAAASSTLTVVQQTLYQVLVICTSGNPAAFPVSMPLQLSCLVPGEPHNPGSSFNYGRKVTHPVSLTEVDGHSSTTLGQCMLPFTPDVHCPSRQQQHCQSPS